MGSSTRVNITPDKTLIQKLGLVGYRTEQAIAELVDNSIDARIPDKKEKIVVALDFESRQIEVNDDGAGMNRGELADAMTIARGSKPDGKLGKFGMGMKSSCSALGGKFTIITSKPDSSKEYTAEHDENLWLSDDSLTWSNFEIQERDLPKAEDWSGTRIIISNLKIPLYANQVSKFKESFGIRYAPYLNADQISIHINTVRCKPRLPDIIPGSRREISIQLDFGNVITGHIALLKKRSIRGNYGIHLFKNGRLIKPFVKFGFTAHPENAKIIGELNLDHVPVNYNKSGFLQDRSKYEEAEEAFRADTDVKQLLRLSQSAREISTSVKSLFDYFTGESKPDILHTRMKNATCKKLLDEADDFSITMNGRSIPIRLESTPGSPLYHIEADGSRLAVTINKANPSFEFVKNPLFLLGFIAAELESIINNPGFAKLIEDRNTRLEKFISDWSAKPDDIRTSRDRDDDLPIRDYGLSDDLIKMHDFLKDRCEFKFQFTGLSTLSQFLHNMMGRLIYTVHTHPGWGDYLAGIISDEFADRFAVLNTPSAESINAVLYASEKSSLIVIREYSMIKGSTIAAPEKAWVDLVNEIYTHKTPIDDQELKHILGGLDRYALLDKDALIRYAKRLKKLEKIDPLMGRLDAF